MQPLLVHNLIYFVLGAVMGSVANAVIYRLPRRVSWWSGGSVCPKCGHQLAWYDLVPVLSYLMLRGKCRYCYSPIPYRYLLVELLLAIGFWLLAPNYLLMAILWITVVVAMMDWETQLVSDWLIALWAITVLSSQFSVLSLYGLLIGVIVIGGIWAISKGRAMGFGDVEIAAVLGLWLGWPRVAPALWISFVAGALVGLWLMVFGKKAMKSKIALGPFLILGAWAAYFWGDTIIKYVLSF